MKNSTKAADLLPATRRRLLADLKRLQDEPIPLATAQPCSDEDMTLWDGVVGVDMDVTHIGCITVPLHFLIDFPADYPQTAPNIGFSFEFEYRGGAQYIMPDGRLKGKKVICLDVLGNFGNIHREWKNSVGSGWSPAYNVTTLLVQLQSVLCDLGTEMSQRERDVTYQSAIRFCEKNPSAILELLDDEDIRQLREERHTASRLAKIPKICGTDLALAKRIELFVDRAQVAKDPSILEDFLTILTDVARGGEATRQISEGNSSLPCTSSKAIEIDSNICCFASGRLYTEALLGVGVGREKKNLGTAAELLSKEAFDGGLRQSTNKSPFEYFLPVWINELHAAQCKSWREALKSSYMEIGSKAFQVNGEDESIIEVFPRLINQMIVEVMRPDAAKSAAIATFEAMCNFWRTLRWLVDTRPTLLARIGAVLSKFVSNETSRHKDTTPDLGVALVLFTVLQGHKDCPTRADFINSYADENALRCVMWWQRSGTRPEPVPVFQATQVSREICMFQMMVVDLIIADVGTTLREIEETNCKLPQRLDKLQARWREQKSSIGSWSAYFRCIGASQPAFQSESAWIADCVIRAAAKGPKYGGGDGKGKGKGGSKGGNGKGWGKR
jgi:ubiquitin-protein ligase